MHLQITAEVSKLESRLNAHILFEPYKDELQHPNFLHCHLTVAPDSYLSSIPHCGNEFWVSKICKSKVFKRRIVTGNVFCFNMFFLVFAAFTKVVIKY